jgi:hypothetical protein
MNMDRDFYVVFADQGNGKALTKGFTNRRVLADFLEISYNTLTNHFVRDKETYHVYEDKGVMVIKVAGMMKGRQRVRVYGPGHNRNI